MREQLKGGSPINNNNNNNLTTPTKESSIMEYKSPSERLLKGLTTTCDGSYGQQLLLGPDINNSLNLMDSVPVEDVMRWKEFRRKQKIISKATEIDIDGFPVSEELSTNADSSQDGGDGHGDDDDDDMILPKDQLLGLASSTSNSEVGTEIASNTARYLAKQSNIMARQLMSSSEEGEEEENNDDDTEDWGVPLDVGDDWDTPLNEDGDDEGQEERIGKVEDCDTRNNSADIEVVDNEGEMSSPSPSQQASPQEEVAASPGKKVVPTMDEVHNFMNQLKQKSAVGRELNSKYSKSSDDDNNVGMNSNSDIKLSSPSPKVAPHAITEGNDTNPPPAATTTSSSEVHKSLIAHRERMKQQKLEGQRKRQEFDARLQLLRSQLHDEAASARLDLLRSKLHDEAAADALAVPSVGDDSITAHRTVEQGEKEVRENINHQRQSSMPVLPGARWSGGLAVWSPSSGGGGTSAAVRSKPTPPKMVSSPSRHDDNNPKQPQQQSNPVQLLPPTGIGIDKDDFSFSPVDVDAVLGKSSGSSSMSSPPGEMELFSEAYGGETVKAIQNSRTIDAVNDDEAKASKSSSSSLAKLKSPTSNVSPHQGGGLGSGYLRGFGNKSMASSVNVELGFGMGVDPPLDDDNDCSEKEEEKLLGVTVVGSKRRKRKSNTPRTSCETVQEHSIDGHKEDDSAVEDGGGGHRRDSSPITLEPATKDAPFERKQLDPDGIDWKDIGIVTRDAHSTEPATPSRSGNMTIDANMEEIESDHMCPDNIFSPKNDNLPPVTPRMTPQARDWQLNLSHQFTPRTKHLPTPRATPRTARAANLSSNRKKFGFGLEEDSPDTYFKMNEKPSFRRDSRVDQSEMDGDERETEQVEDQTNEERSPSKLTKPTGIEDIRSKFESSTFGLDHLQQSLQNFREEKAVEASKRQFKATLLDSPIKESNTPSRIYLEDGDLRAMSSLETDTQASTYYSLSKGVSDDNDATIGDSTLGDGSMDTKKALRYARRLEHSHESEDNSKENHEEEATPSIVALRRKAFESQASESLQKSPDHQNKLDTVGSQKEKRSLSSQRSLLNASNRHETGTREHSRLVSKMPSQDHSSVSQSSPGGKTSVVSSIKERIAAYDGQKSKNGKPSLYRLSSQSKTFQVRVGGQVKSINIRQGANSITNTSMHTAGAVAENEKILPSRDLNQHKQLPSPAANNTGAHYSQHGGGAYYHENEPLSNRNQAAGNQNREMPRVAPIDTTYENSTLDDDDDGITLSPTISEVSGLTFETSLVAGGVVPNQIANEFERMMTPIARLRQRTQGNKFSYDHIDAPTPRSSMEINRSSRRDQIVSRIRETSSNGNLWQRRNVVTEVSHSTSGDTSSNSRNATMGHYSRSAGLGKVAEKVASIDGSRRNVAGESENMSVGDRVAMMNRHSQKHKMRHRNSMNDEPGSSLATRDCIRVD